MKKIFYSTFTLLINFSIFAQTNQQSITTKIPSKQIQPKIMVFPRVEDGKDIKVFYDNNINYQIAIAKINESFQKRGANLRSFDQALKQLKENSMINKSSNNNEDLKATILASSASDIYVEIKMEIVDHPGRSAKSVNLILEASQTGTANSIASKTISGPMFQTEDIGQLTMLAIDKISEDFLNLIQEKFNDIVENGQSVYVEFTIGQDAKITSFDDEISGKMFSELLDNWFETHSKNGVYNNQGVVGSKLIISDMRIPLKKPDNPNSNYTGQTLYSEINKYLKSIGVNSKREIGTNNKIIITIL